jgi:multicomponent Na+:H+ antiporter subunit G
VNDYFSSALLLVGCGFLLLASVGVLRMPDLFNRMQTASKAGTLGISCILLAVAFRMEDTGLALRCVLTIIFFFLTAPVAAHIIGRAAYFVGVPLWEHTVTDELRGQYDMQTHRLSSNGESEEVAVARSD